jgi:hypothetical protein
LLNDPDKLQKLSRWLQQPRSHLVIAAVALTLMLPSLGHRLVMDDHVIALLLKDDPGIRGLRSEPMLCRPLDLFTFTTGDVETNRAMMDEGVLLPWWADENHLNAFLRPLSSFTHYVDFQLWPDSPLLMHLHSVLWFGALLLVVARLYGRLASSSGPPWLAPLAFVLFALDDAHGVTVGWIANRNALVAVTFALPALIMHHRFCLDNWRPGAYLGPLYLLLGLLGGDSAVAVCGYLLAYALFMDEAGAIKGLRRLWGFGAVLLPWLALYQVFDLGSRGSGAYHDPGNEPVAFMIALGQNLPVLLSSQFGIPLTADVAFWGSPRLWIPLYLLSLTTLAAICWLALPLLRRDPRSRFWALGTLLAAVPAAASLPGDRLLLAIGVGAFPLVATIFAAAIDRRIAPLSGISGALRAAVLLLLVTMHLVAAPLLLPLRARTMEILGTALDRAENSIPASESIQRKTAIIVNAPVDIMASYIQVMRASRQKPRPRHLYWLASAGSPLVIRRVSDQTLSVTPRSGFLYTPLERHYQGDPRGLKKGRVIRLSEMSVKITDVRADGRPRQARFTFAAELDSDRYLFLYWAGGEYKPFKLPRPGETTRLPAEDFFQIFFSSMGRL